MSIKQSIILFISAILLGFLMILPFNLICKMTNSCDPIVISYYMPSIVGNQQFEVFFESKDLSKDINIEAQERSVIATSGEKKQISYKIMNPLYDSAVVRPKLYVIPQQAAKYLKFYECLCFKEHKIAARDIKTLNVRFKIDRKIENDEFFKDNRIIRIGYEIN